ncbi:nitroreductase [Aeromicrobium sp. Root495]|uniref:nitroreductase n=1 Tax=Aeromicrobium sp. Root495 TaxID=1736550 RepID=UPI000AA3C826|nr:nitroreductase [Aeromicrobium sp. Root495]
MTDLDVLETLLEERWSCRGFTDEPVDRPTIDRLLTIAGRTPSWCNTQPWNVVVTSPPETAALRDAMGADERLGSDIEFPAKYEGVHAERRRESGWQLYEATGVAKGDREASAAQMMRNFEFFGAPHLLVLTTSRSLGPYGAVDCGLFVDTFLLAVQAAGLGACAQAAVAMRSDFLHEYLGLDEDRQVVCGISFGHPDQDHATNGYRTTRVPLEDFATFR